MKNILIVFMPLVGTINIKYWNSKTLFRKHIEWFCKHNLNLYINSAVQIDVSGNRKAVVIHVPYRLRKAFRKIHIRLVRELEKKFSGKVPVFLFSPSVKVLCLPSYYKDGAGCLAWVLSISSWSIWFLTLLIALLNSKNMHIA